MRLNILIASGLVLLTSACSTSSKNGSGPDRVRTAASLETESTPSESTAEPANGHSTPKDVHADELRRQVDAFAEKNELPGIVCGVVRKEGLGWRHGYRHGSDAPPDAQTVLRIGSITKVMTSLAVLILRDEGKLELSDPVSKHVVELGDWQHGSENTPVLVRHLVQHRSGIPTLGDGSLNWTIDTDITEEELIASIKNCEVNFEPGSRFEYSNVGMALLGVVVSRVSGKTYREFMQERLLNPLRMADSYWDHDLAPSEHLWPGHFRSGLEWKQPESYWALGAIEPAGGLYSTLEDMAKFAAWQLAPGDDEPLSAKSVAESQTIAEEGPVGIGWFGVTHPELGPIVLHNGATYNYSAVVMLAPEKECAVVALIATGDRSVIQEADKLCLGLLQTACDE